MRKPGPDCALPWSVRRPGRITIGNQGTTARRVRVLPLAGDVAAATGATGADFVFG